MHLPGPIAVQEKMFDWDSGWQIEPAYDRKFYTLSVTVCKAMSGMLG